MSQYLCWSSLSVCLSVCLMQGHSAEVICVQFNSTGSQLVTGSFDHTACIWDTETGRYSYQPQSISGVNGRGTPTDVCTL